MANKAHLVVGGFPIGSSAGHDMDFARLQLLGPLYRHGYQTTVAQDFSSLSERLDHSDLLVSYVAGPYPDEAQTRTLSNWLQHGGKWLALHGTSGGRAKRIGESSRQRQMVRLPHHDLLGAYFLNHPPVRKFRVKVETPSHPLLKGLPNEFEVEDELYLVEPIDITTTLLTTQLADDPSPPGFGFYYEEDTSLQPDGKTRVLGMERTIGTGSVCYIALGHTHSPATNSQPFVDKSIDENGLTPETFRGVWTNTHFNQILNNALDWAS